MALGGWWSSINEPSTWASFEDARKAGKGDGVGFVLNGDGVVCIDLDDCVADGIISSEAQGLIDSFPETFVEFSPSNRGLHLWGFGDIQAGRRFERNGLKIGGLRNRGAYLTVTGSTCGSPLANLSLQSLIG